MRDTARHGSWCAGHNQVEAREVRAEERRISDAPLGHTAFSWRGDGARPPCGHSRFSWRGERRENADSSPPSVPSDEQASATTDSAAVAAAATTAARASTAECSHGDSGGGDDDAAAAAAGGGGNDDDGDDEPEDSTAAAAAPAQTTPTATAATPARPLEQVQLILMLGQIDELQWQPHIVDRSRRIRQAPNKRHPPVDGSPSISTLTVQRQADPLNNNASHRTHTHTTAAPPPPPWPPRRALLPPPDAANNGDGRLAPPI